MSTQQAKQRSGEGQDVDLHQQCRNYIQKFNTLYFVYFNGINFRKYLRKAIRRNMKPEAESRNLNLIEKRNYDNLTTKTMVYFIIKFTKRTLKVKYIIYLLN